MERKLAELVVKNLEGHNGPVISVLEAMSMTKVMTDGYDVYAIQKGDVTFLAWVSTNNMTCARTKIVCW